MPLKKIILRSRVRILEYTTESNMEHGKPYYCTTEQISLGAQVVEGSQAPAVQPRASRKPPARWGWRDKRQREVNGAQGTEVTWWKLQARWACPAGSWDHRGAAAAGGRQGGQGGREIPCLFLKPHPHHIKGSDWLNLPGSQSRTACRIGSCKTADGGRNRSGVTQN